MTVPSEDDEQTLLVQWLEQNNIDFYAIPNGGYRTPREAAKFKRTGVKAGVPDICIVHPSKGFFGLYIELKRTVGSSISPKQLEWKEKLNNRGYKAVISYGFAEARDIVRDYLCMI